MHFLFILIFIEVKLIYNMLVSGGQYSNSVIHTCMFLVVSDSQWLHGLQPTRLLCPGVSQARILEWIATPFSRGLPDTGTEPGIYCVAGIFSAVLQELGKYQLNEKKKKINSCSGENNLFFQGDAEVKCEVSQSLETFHSSHLTF